MAIKDLKKKLMKVNTLAKADVLTNSKFFVDDFVSTPIPIINIAFSASPDGGLSKGTTVIAGASKTFKSNFLLLLAKSYLDADDDSVFVYYDNEFGIKKKNFENFGIDPDRIIHKPIENLQEFDHDIVKLLDEVDESDKVFIGVDSLGNIASKKEMEDSLKGSDKEDMSRAKKIKSLFRKINATTHIKNIPVVMINHVYETQEMYSKTVVSGGTGVMYNSDDVWIITKCQEKDGKELLGHTFNINIEKARLVKERSKFPVKVLFDKDGGFDKYSGIFDLAKDLGFIESPTQGWYNLKGKEDQKVRRKELEKPSILQSIVDDPQFKEMVIQRYSLGSLSISDPPLEEIDDEDEMSSLEEQVAEL